MSGTNESVPESSGGKVTGSDARRWWKWVLAFHVVTATVYYSIYTTEHWLWPALRKLISLLAQVIDTL
ncbi:hypothetical protein [Streptomyces sp. NBC_00328]|uniref:hypothetical protein n=1 Tax=Streptomyces sp. NBC_00328 TaxID=2903646 RepID=UPI002E29D303|nr:hypothetical protein [Streptomyces sp. NBC_00328]